MSNYEQWQLENYGNVIKEGKHIDGYVPNQGTREEAIIHEQINPSL